MSSKVLKTQATPKQIKTKQIAKQHNQKQKDENRQQSKKTADKRFESVAYDPKFMIGNSKVAKVQIDKRFADKLKEDKFQINGEVDKYGRKIAKKDKLSDMNDYYYTQDGQQQQQQPKTGRNSKNKTQAQIGKNGKKMKKQQKQAEQFQISQEQQVEEQQNKKNSISKWMQQYNQQSSQQQSQNDEPMLSDSDSVWSQDDKNVIKNQNVQSTKRLALCNYDWMNINAKDLMLLFSSFKPASGTIISVQVYYSQLGKEKLKSEEKYGPQGIWNTKLQQKLKNQKKQKQRQLTTFERSRKQQQQLAFDNKKLRAYQKQRLKYCYAVIQCNSKKTADQIYKQCDGNQFQNSNLLFDLRFIPDDLQFDSSMLKQKCNELPVSGEVKNFVSRALGHSKVQLTWEDPELNNIATLKKKNWNKMTDKELDTIDWGVYMNQQANQAQDNYNKIIGKAKRQQKQQSLNQQQMQANMSDWRKQCNKKYRNKNQDEELQITFPSGFDRQIQPKQKVSLNKQLKTRKQRWQANKNEKRNRQQIQLLVEKDNKQEFTYNPEDDRFKAVFNNPMYSINPVDPKFDHRKVGKAFEEVVKRNKNKNSQ